MPKITGFRHVRRARPPAAPGGTPANDLEQPSRTGFKRLHNQVRESSANNQQFFLAYLALMVFVQTMVISTTDKQLLRSFEGIKLPFIDLTVPLLGFYWVVPFFVLALHFNFLHNLDSHHYKLMQWRYAFPCAEVPRSRIHAFLFDFAVLERSNSLRSVLRAINSFLCLYLGPVTLALVLWRMTDYQDAALTTLHMIAFICNCLLAWQVPRGFKTNAAAMPEQHMIDGGRPAEDCCTPTPTPDNPWWRWAVRCVFSLCIGVVLMEAALGIAAAKLPSDIYQAMYKRTSQKASDWLPGWAFNWTHFGIGNGLAARGIELFLPRINVDPNESIFEVNEDKLKTMAALAGQDDWGKWFYSAGQGLDLRGRSLRGVQLPGQFLPRAMLDHAQLEGANFIHAQLRGADFKAAQLQDADFLGAQLKGASFEFAELRGTNFRLAMLEGANFEFSQPNRTNFYGAQLQGAAFSQSVPQRADFRFAQLQGADFSSAQLERADFSSAQLQGAVFLGAQLSNADFGRAHIQGADFDDSLLQSAIGLDAATPLLGEGPDLKSLNSKVYLEQLEKLAQIVPDEKFLLNSAENIALAKRHKPLMLADLPKANHAAVPIAWADEFCSAITPAKSRDDAMVAGTRNILLTEGKPGIDQIAGHTSALVAFKKLLCTHPSCQFMREKLRKNGDLECEADISR